MTLTAIRQHNGLTVDDLCSVARSQEDADKYTRLMGYLAQQDRRNRKARKTK